MKYIVSNMNSALDLPAVSTTAESAATIAETIGGEWVSQNGCAMNIDIESGGNGISVAIAGGAYEGEYKLDNYERSDAENGKTVVLSAPEEINFRYIKDIGRIEVFKSENSELEAFTKRE